MSLEKITLRNFQVHKNLEVVLSPTVTTIVGDNHAGKSSVIRALRFLALNKLNRSVDRYITHGKSQLKIEAVFEGTKVTRTAGRKNHYKIKGKTFKAVGRQALPEEVERIVNLNSANFQSQLDPTFWFSDSSGVVAKKLNQIVNLSSIDSTLTNVKSRLAKTKTEVSLCEERLEEAKKKREELKWVPAFLAAVEELDALRSKARKARKKARRLRFILRKALAAIKSYKTLTQAYAQGKEAVEKGRKWKIAQRRDNQLTSLIQKIEEAKRTATEELPNITQLETIRADGDSAAERSRKLEGYIEDAEKMKREICRIEKELVKANRNFRSIKTCPTCGQSLKRKPSRSSRPTGT